MDWKKVGLKLAQMGLPLIGGLLGGPAGALGGNAAVSLISSALDLEPEKTTPDNVLGLIQANPESLVRLREAELNNKVELQSLIVQAEGQRIAAETQQILAVNQTIQAEAKSEHWPQWLWRPLWGIISAGAFLVVCVFVCILAYRVVSTNDMTALGMIPVMIGAFATLFGIPGAILGITAWGRNKLKEKKANLAL